MNGLTIKQLEGLKKVAVIPSSNGMENPEPEIFSDMIGFLRDEKSIARSQVTGYNRMYGGHGYTGIKVNVADRDKKPLASYYAVVFDNDTHQIYVYEVPEEASEDGT